MYLRSILGCPCLTPGSYHLSRTLGLALMQVILGSGILFNSTGDYADTSLTGQAPGYIVVGFLLQLILAQADMVPVPLLSEVS